MSEVDVIIRDLKALPGFSSYMVMNNDGKPSMWIVLLTLLFCQHFYCIVS